MTTWTIRRKDDRRGRRFQLNGRGPWRNEYNTDCAVRNTLMSEISLRVLDESGAQVAVWHQHWSGHRIEAIAKEAS